MTEKNKATQANRLALVGEPRAPEPEQLERPRFAVYTKTATVEGKTFRPGTWLHGIKHSNTDGKGIPFDNWICAPLAIEAETVSSEDGSIGRLLKFEHRGQPREWVMPMESLAGRGDEVLKSLMSQGLNIDYQHRRHIPHYLAGSPPERVIATTTRPGWHESGAFVLPERIIGAAEVRYQSFGRVPNLFTSKGDAEAWREEIGRYCLGNPVLIAAVCCALAGPLLARTGVHGGGLHLVGDSSSGKSLAQLVAASIWGNPATFAASWDVTKGGIEIEAASRNDTVLILDEIKRADPKRVQEMAYAIANGVGKGTMTREREGRSKLSWRVLALSSGERSLSEHAALGGNPAHAGAELRLVDVNAGTRTYRAFDDVHGMTGQEFHRRLSEAVTRHYGHLGPALVEQMLVRPEAADMHEALGKMRGTFSAESAQAGRVADRFAILALAGELASTWGLTGWPAGVAADACRQLFNEWVASVGDGNSEDRQILSGIADFIDLHRDSRFSDVKAERNSISINRRAGFTELELTPDGERLLFLFNNAGLKEAAAGFSLDRIARALEAAGALAKQDYESAQKRRTKSYQQKGVKLGRFYVVDPEKLETSNEP